MHNYTNGKSLKIWLMKDEKWLISWMYNIFKLKEWLIKSYFELILNSYEFNYQLENQIKWWLLKFQFNDFNNIDVKFPKDISKQEDIVNKLDTMNNYINELNNEYNLADKQKRYYINKLLAF